MMMQRRLLLIMAWGLAMSLYAQHPEYLHLWQKDGACVSFMLNEHPRSHVRGEEMILETNTQTIAYKLTDDERYAARCWQEMENACNFPDWNPNHFLDFDLNN